VQHLMGVNGVIVDLVKEITEGVSDMIKPGDEEDRGDGKLQGEAKPQFSQLELAFLLKLIPQLIQL
jgi:glycerophosphodiester phosphodiesterase